jgi:hypothetical protein
MVLGPSTPQKNNSFASRESPAKVIDLKKYYDENLKLNAFIQK